MEKKNALSGSWLGFKWEIKYQKFLTQSQSCVGTKFVAGKVERFAVKNSCNQGVLIFFEKYNAASPNPKLKNRQPESNYILLLWQGFEILYCIDIFIQKHLRSFHWACFEAHRKWPCEDNSFRKEKSVKIKVETRNDFEIVWKIHSFIWSDLKRNLCLPKYWLFVLSPPEFSSAQRSTDYFLLSQYSKPC